MWDYINIPDGFVICGIYKITSPEGKIYIGQSKDIRKRWKKYNSRSISGQIKIYRSIVKYGIQNHIFEVIEDCDSTELNRRERYWQDYYDVTSKNGLNLSLVNADEKPRIVSQETKAKMSALHKGSKKPKSEELRRKMSVLLTGKSSMTEDGKRRVSAFMKNRRLRCKLVLCQATGIFYDSVNEAATVYGIKARTLGAYLRGQIKNKTTLIYV